MSDEVKPAKPARVQVKVEPETEGQLDQLLVRNKKLYDKKQAAEQEETDAKAAVKAYLLSLYPDGEGLPDSFYIAADPHGRYPAYTMTLKGKGSYRLNTDAFKLGMPEVYVQYAVPVTPSWDLREATVGQRRR